MRSSGVGGFSSDVFTWSEWSTRGSLDSNPQDYSNFKRHAFLKFGRHGAKLDARLDASVASVRGTSDDSKISKRRRTVRNDGGV